MRKKILFIVQLPPPVHGASLRNESLAKSPILNERFSIRILPLRFSDTLDEIGGYSIRKIWRTLAIYFRFLFTCILHRPQFAYFTITPAGGAFLRDAVFAITLKILGIKIVYHLRGLGIHEASSRSQRMMKVYRAVFRNVTVVCIGKKQIDDLAHLPVAKFFVVPDGIANEVDDSEVSAEKTLNNRTEIIYLSNLVISKGVYDFIAALKKISDEGFDFHARMVGAPADVTPEQLGQKVKDLGLDGRVSIDSPVFGKKKFRLLLDSDIFFFPTYFDLFPGVVLEAMQCGKPVLTSRTGCIPEMVNDGEDGLLVTPRAVGEMAEKLKLLINDAALRVRLGKKARERYLHDFTLLTYEQRMKDVFDQC